MSEGTRLLPRRLSIAVCATALLSAAVAVEPLLAADPGSAVAAKKCKKKSGKRKKCKKKPPATVTPPATTTPTPPPQFPLTVSTPGAGTGTVYSYPAGIECPPDCDEPYTQGQVVSLTASPAFGYVFGGWSGDCVADPCSVTMDAPRAVTANFTEGKTLTVTLDNESVEPDGSVTSSPEGISCTKTGTQISGNCSATFPTNTPVTLTADVDSAFPSAERVTWGGDCSGIDPTVFTCPLTMSTDRTVTVELVIT